MGGGPKPKLVAVRNDRVLEALVALTGQNFEWEAAAWRAWLANERALPAGFDELVAGLRATPGMSEGR